MSKVVHKLNEEQIARAIGDYVIENEHYETGNYEIEVNIIKKRGLISRKFIVKAEVSISLAGNKGNRRIVSR